MPEQLSEAAWESKGLDIEHQKSWDCNPNIEQLTINVNSMKFAKESMRSVSTTKMDKALKGFSCLDTLKEDSSENLRLELITKLFCVRKCPVYTPHKEPQNNVGGVFVVLIYLCGAC